MNLIEFLNSASGEAAGGLITASIVGLVKKIKEAFNGKPINHSTLDELITKNVELRDIVLKLEDELIKGNIINNANKIEIKNQFNNSKFDNTTFN